MLKAFTEEIERVHGKEGLLVKIAEAACLHRRAQCVRSCSQQRAARTCWRRSCASTRRRQLRAAGAYGAALLLPGPLPAHAAGRAGRAGVPLQQRAAPPGAGRHRLAAPHWRGWPPDHPSRRRRANRWRGGAQVARPDPGEGPGGWRTGQPCQLRDLRADRPSRAPAVQGDLGGGRGPLPQSRRRLAAGFRGAPRRVLPGTRPQPGRPGLRGRSTGADDRSPEDAEQGDAAQRQGQDYGKARTASRSRLSSPCRPLRTWKRSRRSWSGAGR